MMSMPKHKPTAMVAIAALAATTILQFNSWLATSDQMEMMVTDDRVRRLEQSPSSTTAAAVVATDGDVANINLVSGDELLSEIEQLHAALSAVTELLAKANIPNDSEVMSKTANLVKRVRTLVSATSKVSEARSLNAMSEEERKAWRVQERQERNRLLRQRERERIRKERRRERNLRLRGAGGIGNGEVEDGMAGESQWSESQTVAMQLDESSELELEERHLDVLIAEDEAAAAANNYAEQPPDDGGETPVAVEQDVARHLYDTTITFPECNEKFLDQCLEILNEQMIDLQMEATTVIHEKRNTHQSGYNKVVIVTNLEADLVKGRLHDGIVTYPFLWDDAVTQTPHLLGVQGSWDCHAKAPEDCCALIKESAPNPDVNGNYIECHIFVPYGGVGNKKRSDRIFVNLSPDGRVHEPPFIA